MRLITFALKNYFLYCCKAGVKKEEKRKLRQKKRNKKTHLWACWFLPGVFASEVSILAANVEIFDIIFI